MNPDLMAALSLGVATSLFVVLIAFVRRLAASLQRTSRTLVAGVDLATTVRQDCEQLVGGVLALNSNLATTAAALKTAADAARRETAQPLAARNPAVAPAHPTPPIRQIREPSATRAVEPVASWTIRDPNAATQPADDADRWVIREPRPPAAQPTGRHSKEA